MLQKVRIDKWLWSIRIFKTRTKATKACDEGKVKINDDKVKSAYKVKVGEVVHVRVNFQNRVFKVVELIEKRVGAEIAVKCYEDLTPPEELIKNKFKSSFAIPIAYRKRGEGRPTKRERRDIDKYREDWFEGNSETE